MVDGAATPSASAAATGETRAAVDIDARPYRSHRIPACELCHRRKSRCLRARLDEPCSLCRAHQKQCKNRTTLHVGRKSAKAPPTTGQPTPEIPPVTTASEQLPQQHLTLPSTCAATSPAVRGAVGTLERSTATPSSKTSNLVDKDAVDIEVDMGHGDPTGTSAGPELSSHIVGPTVAPDIWMLEQYMSPRDNGAVSHVHPNPYSIYSNDPRNPVVYLKIPRQRTMSLAGNGTSGFKQCEILENIIAPLGSHLFELYFDVIHPAFPFLDEQAVKAAYLAKSLPHTLVCEIYSVSLLSWDLSPALVASGRSPPDLRYVWNQTVSAMHEDFQSPSISTVLACILDILGRPITSITYNAINIGSSVALAQSLGLNRNPEKWKLDPRQKNLRLKTWWSLLIHDVWASLCHGTPGHIHRDQWDVDLPTLSTIFDHAKAPSAPQSEPRLKGARSFIALCQLTKLLEEALSIVFSLRQDPLEQILRNLRRIDANIDEWQDSLPLWLNPNDATFERNQPGFLNLQISFLAVKLCVCRAAWQATRMVDDVEASYYQIRCIKSANQLIDAVALITAEETNAFWLPYTAYHFASAATLMMRCALEVTDESIATDCVNSACKLIDHLREMKRLTNWDLADICLNQCEATVRQMSDNNHLDLQRGRKAYPRRVQAAQNTAAVNQPAHDNAAAMAENTYPAGGADVVLENEGFFEQFGEDMMEDFYFPDLWHVSHF